MSRSRHRSSIWAAVALVLAASVLSCNSGRGTEEGLRQEAEALERKTTPPEATVAHRSGPMRSNFSVTASWDVDTTMDRAEYAKWVTAQLQPEFKALKAVESQLTFSKHEDGDTHSVECTLTPTKIKLHIHVAFSAHPSMSRLVLTPTDSRYQALDMRK